MQVLTFDGALAREVVLEEILALMALEESVDKSAFHRE